MMTLVKGLPENVVGVAAHGQVTAHDYENVLIPAVEAALGRHDKVRVYYQIGADFAGFDLGAAFADLRIGLGRLMHWERIAVVTDIGWIRDAFKVTSFLIPAQVRIFETAQAEDAKAWIAA